MKKRYMLTALGLFVFLLILYPRAMISPGELAEGHQKQENECLSCHQPFRGISSENCISCHTLSEIGKDTAGRHPKAVFHQQLADHRCSSCHTEHQGRVPAHAHSGFTHELLPASIKNDCKSCHQKPNNTQHRLLTENCGTCHSTSQWEPSTFDHSAYFVLDQDHNASCNTCHTKAGNSFKSYTCYGCHEHSEKNIVAEHNEEGIFNLSNCASCHSGGSNQGIKKNSKSLNEDERNNIGDYIESKGQEKEDDD